MLDVRWPNATSLAERGIIFAVTAPDRPSSFRRKALLLATALLLCSLAAALTAVYLTSRAVVRGNLRDSADHQVDLTAGYLDVVYDEALRSLELIGQDGYVLLLARELYAESRGYERVQLAMELATYLNVRYFGQREFSSLFLISDRFLLGNFNRSGSAVETVNVLAPRSPELLRAGTADATLDFLRLHASDATVLGDVDPRQLLTLPLADGLFLVASVDLAAALATFDDPVAVLDDSHQVLAENRTLQELRRDHPEEIARLVAGAGEGRAGSGRYYAASRPTNAGELLVTQLFNATDVFRSLGVLLAISVGIGLVLSALWLFPTKLILRRVTGPLAAFNKALKSKGVPDDEEFVALIRRFGRRSRVQQGMRWFFLSLVVPVGATIAIVFFLFQGFIQEQRAGELLTELRNEARNLSFEVQTLREYTVTLALDPEMQSALSRQLGDRPETTRAAFSEIIFRKGTLLRDVSHISLYGRDRHAIYPTLERVDGAHGDDWTSQVFRHRGQNVAWLLEPDGTEASLIVRVRGVPSPVHNVTFLTDLGYVEVRSRNLFESMAANGSTASTGAKVIVDTDRRIVRQLSGERITDLDRFLRNDADGLGPPGAEPAAHREDAYNVSYRPIDGTSWLLVHLITDAELRSGAQTMVYYGAIVLLGLVLVVYALSDIATGRLLKPVAELHTWMEDVALTRGDEPKVRRVDNEFVQLIAGFTGMLDRVRAMAEEVRRKEVERVDLDRRKKETQLVALQTQMNPHFLYNIFSSVDFLIDLGRHDEASRMLEATGQLFHKGMYRGRLVVPLSEELEHVRAYLAIQEIRHRDEIAVRWEIDESLLRAAVPKFILQPMIENSIEHGMRKRKGIAITVTIRGDARELVIVVEDNGNGIEHEKLCELRSSLEAGEQSEHLGLANVSERICLHHGVHNPVRIRSEPDEGCRVEIRIPRYDVAATEDRDEGVDDLNVEQPIAVRPRDTE